MTKPTQWHVRPAKTQISLGIRPVWSESSLSAWRKLASLATDWAHSEDSDQTGRMHRLIRVFSRHTYHTCHCVGFVVWWLICNICVEIHNMNLQRKWGGRPLAIKAEQKCVHVFGNEGRSEMWNYRSFAVKAEGKCGGGTSHIWQWRQSVSGEADLQIFGSQDWAKVQKRNCKSLEVQAEMKCGSGTSHLWKSLQNKCGKWNFRCLPVKAERKCRSRTSHIW